MRKIAHMVDWINSRERIGCKVYRTKGDHYFDESDELFKRTQGRHKFLPNIMGQAKDGRVIAIHYTIERKRDPKRDGRCPRTVASQILAFMKELYERSPYVGIALDIEDVCDILLQRTRRKYTYLFLGENHGKPSVRYPGI